MTKQETGITMNGQTKYTDGLEMRYVIGGTDASPARIYDRNGAVY